MLPRLHDRQRGALFRWGVLAVVAASALGPLSGSPAGVRSRVGSALELRVDLEPLPRLSFPSVRIGADPFAAKAANVAAGTVVRAVIFGETPRALIEIGNKEVIVGVGDIVAGVRVREIDDRGVHLSDGSFIPLRGTSP